MNLEHPLYFFLLALLAEILGTIGGFGSSIFFIPIATYFLDFQSALGITAIFHVSSNLSKITLFRHGFDKKLILSFGIPAIVSVVLGAFLSAYIDVKSLEIFLAFFMVAIGVLLLVFSKFTLVPSLSNAIGGGLFSGLVAGLIGTGGAIRGIVLAGYDLGTEVFIATSAVIDLGIDLSRSGVYLWNGYVHRDDLALIPILFLLSFVGTYIGKLLLKRFTKSQFRKTVLLLIIGTGLLTIVKWLF